MAELNCLPPRYEPRISDHISTITGFLQELVDNKNAYIVDGDVYFKVNSFSSYGKLSKQNINKDLMDFSTDFKLWDSNIPFFKSPWSDGKPECIECPIFASLYLGSQIDIHGGGANLIFPHHENSIAQIECLSEIESCSYWVHVGLVDINEEKMSKSLNNTITLQEVFSQFDPMVLRFYYLNHYYRNSLNFSFEDLTLAQKKYNQLCLAFQNYSTEDVELINVTESLVVKKMLEQLCDDLNTPALFDILFEQLDYLQKNPVEASLVKKFIIDIIGLTLCSYVSCIDQ